MSCASQFSSAYVSGDEICGYYAPLQMFILCKSLLHFYAADCSECVCLFIHYGRIFFIDHTNHEVQRVQKF